MAQGRHPECLGHSVAAADQVPWGYAEKDPGACPFGGLEGGSFPQSSLKMKLHLEPQAKNSGIKRVYDGAGVRSCGVNRMTFQKPPQDSVPSFFSHSWVSVSQWLYFQLSGATVFFPFCKGAGPFAVFPRQTPVPTSYALAPL